LLLFLMTVLSQRDGIGSVKQSHSETPTAQTKIISDAISHRRMSVIRHAPTAMR
jgi:hypothetical protein